MSHLFGGGKTTQQATMDQSAYSNGQSAQNQINDNQYRSNALNQAAPVAQSAGGYGVQKAAASTAQNVGADQSGQAGLAQTAQGMQGLANGTDTNTAANQTMRTADDRSVAQQMAMAASGGGAQNAGLASRNAANNAAATSQVNAGTAAATNLAGQQQAQSALANTYNSMQANAYTGQANQAQQNQYNASNAQQVTLANQAAQNNEAQVANANNQATNLANQQAQGQQNALGQQTALTYQQMIEAQNNQDTANAIAYQAQSANNYYAAHGLTSQSATAAQAANSGIFNNMVSSAASVAGAATKSDVRAKEDIKSGAKKLDSFLNALGTHDYKYKDDHLDEHAAPGRHVSVMAQELEKSEIGAKLVSEDAQGDKIVDYGKGLPAMLAAMARLNERTSALEAKKKGK